jgi:hypothetical protein
MELKPIALELNPSATTWRWRGGSWRWPVQGPAARPDRRRGALGRVARLVTIDLAWRRVAEDGAQLNDGRR